MARTGAYNRYTAIRGLPQSLGESLSTLATAFLVWRQSVARRRAIAELTIDELQDIGYPADQPLVPTLDIKAGLITNLMSMR